MLEYTTHKTLKRDVDLFKGEQNVKKNHGNFRGYSLKCFELRKLGQIDVFLEL